jgi:hypothetical protein
MHGLLTRLKGRTYDEGAERIEVMHPRRAPLIITILFFAGCGRSSATYQQAVTNTVKSEPHVAAFEKLFPGSRHFITYYTGVSGTPRWNSKALIHGRYVLTMQFDVTIDRSGTQMTAASKPAYYLHEVSNVELLPDGRAFIRYKGESQREFGLKEWSALEAAGGDLSALGLNVKRDQPVPNLAGHW